MSGEGDVTVSPCFSVELRILLSSIFGEKNLLGFVIFGQLVRLFLSQAVVWGEGSLFQRTNVYRTIVTDSQFPKFLFPPRLINKWRA